ncbi:MAG: GIY-YIG nuclease family protein [Patescibacteria group bacterium]|nr:GIY-YIG nuclease family protein [Patescibacteria group bacterium]
MHYLYILKSKVNGELYIGNTGNIKKRLEEHNSGKQKATKRYKPWKIVYLEGYFSENDAKIREHNLKYFGKAYSQLKRRIKNSLQES